METIESLATRIGRLEQLLDERAMEPASRPPSDQGAATNRDAGAEQGLHPFWDAIPFSAWLKISGPTFAVMALGFGTVWSARQETTQQILDLEQSTTDRILQMQRETSGEILRVQQETTAKILRAQQETTAKILALQESTTDRILEIQGRILDLERSRRE